MTISRMQQPRQMYQEGGIMPRLNQLGSGVSSAEQTLQQINQRLESAESSLGGGGAMQQPVGSGNLFELAGGYNTSQRPAFNLLQRPLSLAGPTTQLPSVQTPDPFFGNATLPSELGLALSPMSSAMRSMAADGGMMGRQMYGLGSLVKSIGKGVKSAVSGVKDFVKSDVGKAALLTAGGFGLAGMGPLKGLAGLLPAKGAGKFLFSPVQGSGSFFGGLVDKFQGMGNFGKAATMFGVGSLGGAALEALTAAGVEDETQIRDVESLKAYLRQGYKKLNQEASPEQVEAFVTANTTEYKADGGRMGYADGMNDPSDLPRGLQIDTTTRNPIPENALQEEIESVVRIMMGPGSAGIGEPEDGTMKGYQFFRKQYLPKKIKELSENFGYSEDEIYKMLNLKVREFKESPELLQKPKMAMGGRIGFEDGTPKSLLDMIKIKASGSKSGKQQISGAPEGFTIDSETYNAIVKADIPLSQKIDLLASYEYGKGRNKVEKDDQEIFLGEGGFKDRNIGLGFNKDGEGFGGTLMYNMETGKPEFKGTFKKSFAEGGRLGYAFGNPEQNAINAAGIMDLPLNQNPAGATELDLRETGGFIPPVGVKEKADDIPAMLSNNEFVFTADAVKGMGDGDVNKGAQRMYDMMKKLEGGGRV